MKSATDCAGVPQRTPAQHESCPGAAVTQREGRRVLLRARDLRKAFGGQIVLDGVSLDLHEGEVVLLRGDNGSGKTTLLNILTGNLEPDSGSIWLNADGTEENFHFPFRWWHELNPFNHFTPEKVASEAVGRTWQDIRLFGSQTLRNNIAVAKPGHPGENPILALFASGRAARRENEIIAEADAMLARFGLAGREESSADKVSLGQSKRIAIVRAVAAGARILFLDEPLAGLDMQGIRDVLALLESIARDHAVTIIIIEHVFNHSQLRGFVTTDWLLEAGNILTNHRRSEGLVTNPADYSEGSIPAWLNRMVKFAHDVTETPLPRGASLLRIRPAGQPQGSCEPLLEVSDLIVRRGSRTIIGLDAESDCTGLNLTVYKGELTILQAPNGWGKSTLLEALAGLIRASAGRVAFDGIDVSSAPAWRRRHAGIQLIPATGSSMPSLNVNEYAALAGIARPPDSLRQFGPQKVGALSGGQSRLLAIATAASTELPVLRLFDEPFSMLDAVAIDQAAQFLQPNRQTATLIAVPTSYAPRSLR